MGAAVAEIAFYRLLFFAESPGTPWPKNAAEYTAFSAAVATDRAIDLRKPPLDRDLPSWTHLADYAPCQTLAEVAREAELEIIRYQSVRDPGKGANVAVLTCAAFSRPRPLARHTWRIRMSPSGVQAICEFPEKRTGFGRSSFAADPRIAQLRWDR